MELVCVEVDRMGRQGKVIRLVRYRSAAVIRD